MIAKNKLKVDRKYKCKITEDYALAMNKPEWNNKIVTLKYTGLWFRSLKDKFMFFAYESDVEPIEEIK